MNQRLWLVCVVLFIGVVPFTSSVAQQDEVFIAIPAAVCPQALQIAPSPIRLYHRLGASYLAGTTRRTFSYLKKRHIECVIVDDRPWSMQYAIVSRPHPMQRDQALDALAAIIAFAEGDEVVIKGTSAMFDELRSRGFACVEIERVEIPFDPTASRLPSGTSARARSIRDSLISFVSDTMVRNSVQGLQSFGTRYWNNPNRDSVSRWVRAQYLAAGITDVRLDSFQYSGTWQANVVATLPGINNPSSELIVGGHHDSYSSNVLQAPGADDNASGVTAAMEMARVIKLLNYQPVHTLRFIGFAAEEAGLRGSASYAQRARQAQRDIRAMLNYDMIGYRNQSQPDRDVYVVWYTGAEALSAVHVATATAYTPLTPILTTSYRSGSDSYSFWQQGYKSVFLIERDFNPYYHTPNDLLQYIDIPYCAEIVRAGLATLITLDQLPPSVTGYRLRDRGNGTALFATWDSVPALDFAAYKISVGRSPGVYDTSFTQRSCSRLVTGLTEGVQYFVGVSMVDIVGGEGFITELHAVPRTNPLPPAGLVAESLTHAVRLKWRQNTEMDLLGYNVYRSVTPSPGGPYILLTASPTADTTWIDSVSGTFAYYTTAVDSLGNQSAPSDTVLGSSVTSVVSHEATTPFAFALYRNYPNPFNALTQLRYEIGTLTHVALSVFDILGREVAILVDETKEPGTYVAVWDATLVASGVYLVRLKAEHRTSTIRITVLK